jgi:hypothetical protein
MRSARTTQIVSLAFAVLAACSSVPQPAATTPVGGLSDVPAGVPDIQGTVTKVMAAEGDAPLRLLVEAGAQKDVVSVTPATRVYRDDEGKHRSASAADLKQGTLVTAWYDGAVMESYPRQANAVAIVIAGER